MAELVKDKEAVLAEKQVLGSNLVQVKRFDPQIVENLDPKILWARTSNCGNKPCKGKYS